MYILSICIVLCIHWYIPYILINPLKLPPNSPNTSNNHQNCWYSDYTTTQIKQYILSFEIFSIWMKYRGHCGLLVLMNAQYGHGGPKQTQHDKTDYLNYHFINFIFD